MSNPEISVVIPTYNSSKFITKTLDYLKKQSFKNFEVAIINDGSTDNTQLIVFQYMAANLDLSMRLINQENRGIASARNRGILESRGNYIAFLDHDDVWYPEKLSRCLKIFMEHPKVNLVCHDELMRDSSEKAIWRLHYGPYTPQMFRKLLFKRNCLSTSAVMVKRNVLMEVGLFRENPELFSAEDLDLWIRLSKNHTFYFINEILGEYIMRHDSASQDNLEKHYKSQIAVIKLNFKEYREKNIFDYFLIRIRLSRLYLSIVKSAFIKGNIKNVFKYLLKAFLQFFIYA